MPAVGTGEHWRITGTSDLHQNRTAPNCLARGGERRRGDPRGPGLPLAQWCEHHAGSCWTGCAEFLHPPDIDKTLDVGGAGEPGEDKRELFLLLPDQRGVARVDAG